MPLINGTVCLRIRYLFRYYSKRKRTHLSLKMNCHFAVPRFISVLFILSPIWPDKSSRRATFSVFFLFSFQKCKYIQQTVRKNKTHSLELWHSCVNYSLFLYTQTHEESFLSCRRQRSSSTWKSIWIDW